MAKLTGPVQFTGTLGGVSAYKIAGSDELFAREKGGPSSYRVKNDRGFANTRRNNAEFSSVNEVVRRLKRAIGMIDFLRDYNYTPTINGLCLDIQKMDRDHKWGERGYMFSLYGQLLEGFSFNKRVFFSNIVRPSVSCQINRDAATATVVIPTLKPGKNFFLPWQTARFRFIIELGTMDDFTCEGKACKPLSSLQRTEAETTYTPWFYATDTMRAQTLTLQLKQPGQVDAHKTMIVSIGIQAGSGTAADELGARDMTKYSAGRILTVG
jgi:hypothetical protein